MNAIEMLQEIERSISVHDGPIHPNDTDGVILEFSFESGWLCYLSFAQDVSGLCSKWHDAPDAAVTDLHSQFKAKYR